VGAEAVDAAAPAHYNAAGSIQLGTYAVVGSLMVEYCVTPEGTSFSGFLGGCAAYAASGARVWLPDVSVVSLVGCDFPNDLIQRLALNRIDVSCIKVIQEAAEHRRFYACPAPGEKTSRNPPSHYLRLGLPLPKELIDIASTAEAAWTGTPPLTMGSLLASLSGKSRAFSAVHVCPTDYPGSTALPLRMRELGATVVTLDPDPSFMEPYCLRDLPAVVKGLSAFLPSLEEAQQLFSQFPTGTWEMAEAISEMGCETVVIKSGAQGQLVWDSRQNRRWIVPAYPSRVRDIQGIGDAYCGGFLAGLGETGDALEAALRGSVSASLSIEGTGALYPLDSHPRLAEARLEFLRKMVKMA